MGCISNRLKILQKMLQCRLRYCAATYIALFNEIAIVLFDCHMAKKF